MKKCNIVLIIITSVLSLITILNNIDQGIIITLKDASIILTLTLPYIIKKMFKIELNELFITFWIIFIFMAHYLGVTIELYNKIEYFDKIVHTLSGVVSAYVAYQIIEYQKIKNKSFGLLFIISFTFLCAGMWEIFEFTFDSLFGFDAQLVQKTGVTDTMTDIIVALIGAVFFSIAYLVSTRNQRY